MWGAGAQTVPCPVEYDWAVGYPRLREHFELRGSLADLLGRQVDLVMAGAVRSSSARPGADDAGMGDMAAIRRDPVCRMSHWDVGAGARASPHARLVARRADASGHRDARSSGDLLSRLLNVESVSRAPHLDDPRRAAPFSAALAWVSAASIARVMQHDEMMDTAALRSVSPVVAAGDEAAGERMATIASS